MKRRVLIILTVLALVCGLGGCKTAKEPVQAQAVRELECTHPAALSGMCAVTGSKAAVCWTDSQSVTTVQLVDTESDSVEKEISLDGEWVIKPQSFCDKRIALCDREHDAWRFLTSGLADIAAVHTENSDGYFSYDVKSYYFLRDDILYRQELESGEVSRVELDYDLRFLDIIAFDSAGSRMILQFYLSPYSSECGTAMLDPVTGKFTMLCTERYQAKFQGGRVCLMSFDENAMGYSVLSGVAGNNFSFVAADIFLDGSSEIYGIADAPYLVGTRSEITTLYSVAENVQACRLSDCVIPGEMYQVCSLPEENVLLGAVFAGGVYSLYVIEPAALEFEPIADAASVASPLTVSEAVAQSYLGKTSDGEVAQTLSQARQRADELEKKYGVRILLSSQCAEVAAQCEFKITLTDTMDAAEELGSISASLDCLDRVLALYPEGFFAQMKNSSGDGGIRFLLVEAIDSGYGTVGCTYERFRWQNVALDIRNAYGMDSIVCHELWHATENCILSRDYSAFTVEDWTKYDPQGFSYYEDYSKNDPDGRRWTYYSGGDEGVYFVDGYSRVNAKEDRARIMEYFMTRDDDARELIKSPAIEKKLRHMSEAIRKNFDTSGWENVRWERLL